MFIEEDYVSFETAKLLKENGYNEECAYYIIRDEDGCIRHLYASTVSSLTKTNKILYKSPTLYEAQKWLREKHKMFVSAAPQPPFTKPLEFFYWIDFPEETIDNYGSLVIVEHFSSYEQALDKGIQDALDFIKMNNNTRR